jgi:hypothetical protein
MSIPTSILLTEYSHSSRIDKNFAYIYSSTSAPTNYELNLNADIGEVEIKYTSQPVDYLIKLDVIIEMGGSNLDGKSHLDFFNIIWQNASSRINFTLELKAGINQDQVLPLIENIFLTLTLRADVICDISINMKIQGDVKITVPWESTVGEIFTNITKGNIQYDLSNCIIGGNITGNIQEAGDIELITYEVEYIQNSTWFLHTYNGEIALKIYQDTDMKANVSGVISHNFGNIYFVYIDENINNGAYFTLHYDPSDGGLTQAIDKVTGFDFDHDSEQNIFYLESGDYPAQNNHNLLFFNTNGRYMVLDLQSS